MHGMRAILESSNYSNLILFCSTIHVFEQHSNLDNPKITLDTTTSTVHYIFVNIAHPPPHPHPSPKFSQCYKVAENLKCIEWSKKDIEDFAVYYIILNIYQWGPNLFQFAVRPSVLDMKGCRKSQMHQMTSQWHWTLHCQRYSVYAYSWRAIFCQLCPTTNHFIAKFLFIFLCLYLCSQ